MQPTRLNDIGVYCIRNKVNGNIYIGSSSHSIKRRWGHHRRLLKRGKHVNPHLQHAWEKYGEKSFEFIILEAIINRSAVIGREQWWIDNSRNLYNLAKIVGKPTLGRHLSEETKQKISLAHKQNPLFAEMARKMGRKNAGKKQTVEHRRNVSVAMSGRKLSDKHRESLSRVAKNRSKDSISNSNLNRKGKKHTTESIIRMSFAHKGRSLSEESRRKISIANKGFHHSSVTRRKIGEANSKTYFGFVCPDGIEYRNVKNLTEFCRIHNLTQSNMQKVSTGKRSTHKGWKVITEIGESS